MLCYSCKMPLGIDAVVIKISDTDVVVNAVHHSPSVKTEMLILWGTKENRKVFSARDITDKIGEDMKSLWWGYMYLLGMEKYRQSVDLARLILTKRSLRVNFW